MFVPAIKLNRIIPCIVTGSFRDRSPIREGVAWGREGVVSSQGRVCISMYTAGQWNVSRPRGQGADQIGPRRRHSGGWWGWRWEGKISFIDNCKTQNICASFIFPFVKKTYKTRFKFARWKHKEKYNRLTACQISLYIILRYIMPCVFCQKDLQI